MNSKAAAKYYSPNEERINIYSHAFGFFLSLVGLLLLVIHAMRYGNALQVVSFAVFGLSLVNLYATSTIYHRSKDEAKRIRLRVYDHIAIYILIAGSYTPFALITLHGKTGWILFSLSWLLALVGAVLKLFFTGKLHVLSTITYVLMGWIVLFVIRPLIDNISHAGLVWLVAGGLSYSFGAVLYSIKRIPFNHALFHVFVLAGSACHFVSVYLYVLPSA